MAEPMTQEAARAIVIAAWGDRDEAATSCFGDCCIRRPEEKQALLTLLYGPDRG